METLTYTYQFFYYQTTPQGLILRRIPGATKKANGKTVNPEGPGFVISICFTSAWKGTINYDRGIAVLLCIMNFHGHPIKKVYCMSSEKDEFCLYKKKIDYSYVSARTDREIREERARSEQRRKLFLRDKMRRTMEYDPDLY